MKRKEYIWQACQREDVMAPTANGFAGSDKSLKYRGRVLPTGQQGRGSIGEEEGEFETPIDSTDACTPGSSR